jgi:hypothetical protein
MKVIAIPVLGHARGDVAVSDAVQLMMFEGVL